MLFHKVNKISAHITGSTMFTHYCSKTTLLIRPLL